MAWSVNPIWTCICKKYQKMCTHVAMVFTCYLRNGDWILRKCGCLFVCIPCLAIWLYGCLFVCVYLACLCGCLFGWLYTLLACMVVCLFVFTLLACVIVSLFVCVYLACLCGCCCVGASLCGKAWVFCELPYQWWGLFVHLWLVWLAWWSLPGKLWQPHQVCSINTSF